jgi:hypothetical protein
LFSRRRLDMVFQARASWSALPSAAAANDSVVALSLRGSPSIPTLSSEVPSISPIHSFPTRTNNPLSSDSLFMSSTELITISPSNSQSIIDALGDYALRMGIDFAQNPFAKELQRTNTPNDILTLLQQRENAFMKHRDRNRTLINSFSPTVRVLHIFSEKLGDAVNLVSFATLFLFSFRCDRFNSTSLALPSRKGYLCWNRCSPHCTSI